MSPRRTPSQAFGRARLLGARAVLLCAGFVPGAALAQVVAPSPLDPTQGDIGAVTTPNLGPLSGGSLRGADPSMPGETTDPGSPPPEASPDTPDADGAAPRRAGPVSTVRPVETSTAKPRLGPPPLPNLVAYPRSVTARRALIGPDAAATAIPPLRPGPTVAVVPVPPPLRRPLPDLTPFAPLGYTFGSLRVTPYVEQSLGFDSNPDQIATKVKPSAFSRTEGGFDLLSLWSANQLKAVMRGGYDAFFSDPGANRPDASGVVDYRYDVSRDIALDAEGRFAVSTQRPGSPEVNAAVVDRPLVSSYGATLGGSDTFGRFTFGLHALVDRTVYENGRLSDGTVVVLNDQTYNDYALDGRLDYELLPTIKPFAEVTVDTRVHDRRLDQSGYERDSDGVVGRLGTTFEIGPLVTGTLSAGYEDRSYQDPRLKDLQGPVIDGSLAYAITPLTTVTLATATTFNETNVIGSAGSESRSVALQVSHALLRNLTLTGVLAYLNTDYRGTSIVENTYSATLRASYNITRSIVLDASYNHQTLKSTAPGSNYQQDLVMVGMRLQH